MTRRVLTGTVVSAKCDKSVVVTVQRHVMHPKYKKFMTRSKKYMAHDEQNAFREGDVVDIAECRPVSKRKTWEVIGKSGGAQ